MRKRGLSMKLAIELLPESSWGRNLRDVISPYRWQKLSQAIQKNADYKCEICGRKKGGGEITRLNCHEVWEFDEVSKVQRLIGLQALCFECHCGKHIGYSLSQEWIDTNKIIEHILRTNKISLNEYKQHEKEAYELWAERCQIEWIIDYGEWNYLVEQESRMVTKQERLQLVRDILLKNPKASNKEIHEILSKTIQVSIQSTKRYASIIRREFTTVKNNK